MTTIQGLYSSGKWLISIPVTVVFEDDGSVRFSGEGISSQHRIEDIGISDRLAEIPRYLYLPDGATIESPDNASIDAVLSSRRRGRVQSIIHFLETKSAIAAAATSVILLTVAGTLYFGLPGMAQKLASRVPPEIDKQVGEQALEAFRPYMDNSVATIQARRRVQTQLRRLLPGVSDVDLPRIIFCRLGTANAFALPGNNIVLSMEFLNLVKHEDELAAVLAHELGHLKYRHGIQNLFRNSLALLFVATLTGDLSSLSRFGGTIPLMLVQNGYSRSFERAADRHALSAMIAAEIPPRRFSSILARMEKANGNTFNPLSHVSTHPSVEERAALFDVGDPLPEPAPGVDPPPSSAANVTSPRTYPATRFSSRQSTHTTQLDANGGVQPVPMALTQPIYPPELHAAGIEGEVNLSFIVEVDGSVSNPVVVSSDNDGFNASAIAAVSNWRFFPGRLRDGKPVRVRMAVPIKFMIREHPSLRPQPEK